MEERDFCALSFSEKERICERIYMENGPFWHLYTDGTVMQNIFCSEGEFGLGVTLLAVSACGFNDIRILTFELMSNHMHVVMAGSKDLCLNMFDDFKNRLARTFRNNGRILPWDKFQVEITPVETLKQLRSVIIYTNRNGFVSNPKYTPFSYPWGGGCEYFRCDRYKLPLCSFGEMTVKEKRAIAHTRDVSGLERLAFCDGIVHIPSFCDINLGESMFTDARSYFYSLGRGNEELASIAHKMKNSVFLIDEEVFSIAAKTANEKYGISKLAMMTPEQKIELAKDLRYKYNASSQQIRRILRLEPNVLKELFHC